MNLRLIPLVAFAAILLPAQDHWVATWTTAQLLAHLPTPGGRGRGGAGRGAPKSDDPAQAINARGFNQQTVRMIAHTSIAGRRLRIKLENAFGGAPVVVGAAHIALREKDSAIVTASDRALAFGGKPGVTIPPGAAILSDALDFQVPARTDLAVSLYFPGETGAPTSHLNALHNTYISKEGDTTGAASMPDAIVTQSSYFLAAIDVAAPPNAFLLVAFGDSITDGHFATNEANASWPDVLAARLSANKQTANIAVANQGINGNRVLRDGTGVNALARFDFDVLGQSGVKWMTLLEGVNDIGRGKNRPADAVTGDDLIAGYKQIIERAHTHGIKVIGCTLTPDEGYAMYWTDEGEKVREAVNQWILTGGAFDAVVDFDKATRDSTDPKRLAPNLDSGDHLHPSDAGYKAMADAFDLGILTRRK